MEISFSLVVRATKAHGRDAHPTISRPLSFNVVILLLCLGFPGPLPSQTQDGALLPPNGFLQAWNKSEKTRVFTSSDLYGFIDGGAEIFLEFGFEQLTVQPYVKGTAGELQLEIYRMTDPASAAGIYLMNCGKESPDPSFSERHTINQYQLLFKHDRYYVVINNSDGKPELRPAVLDFARYIASRLPADKPLTFDGLLPPKGLNRNSVRLIRGPYALQSVFTLGNGDILQLGRKLTAVSGNYQDAAGRYTLIVVDYPQEQDARKAFLNVQANLDSYLKVQGKSDRRLVFKDYSNEYGVVSVAGKRLTVQVHLPKQPTL